MIFISHRQSDTDKAKQLHTLLKGHSVESYLDVVDGATSHAPDITKHIIGNLKKCTHLIVVYSNNTAGSMWVPFELGAAYIAGKGIGTMLFSPITTPEYLDTFQKMRDSADLAKYIEVYKADQTLTKSARFDNSTQLSESARISEADSFIKRVKGKLGQY